MAYVRPNFKTKKALKDAVKRYQRLLELIPNYGEDGCMLTAGAVLAHKEFGDSFPREVRIWQPGGIFDLPPGPGREAVEGPHYPEPHKWYAIVEYDEHRVVTKVVK